ASVSPASSPRDDTDNRCVPGGPICWGAEAPVRATNRSGLSPRGEELKTMVPSAPTKRAVQTICGSNVRGVNVMGSIGAVLLTTRAPKKPAAPAARTSAAANGQAPG